MQLVPIFLGQKTSQGAGRGSNHSGMEGNNSRLSGANGAPSDNLFGAEDDTGCWRG